MIELTTKCTIYTWSVLKLGLPAIPFDPSSPQMLVFFEQIHSIFCKLVKISHVIRGYFCDRVKVKQAIVCCLRVLWVLLD